jgi:hypothetical protein
MPKDKPNAEGAVGKISTWITAALRNEQFFTLAELNQSVKKRLEAFNARPFQKKEGSRLSLFRDEEKQILLPLPAARFETAEFRQCTVQFNYHISVDGMLYSVPYEYIKRQVEVRLTDTAVEIFCGTMRIASHRRLYGRKGQYSTVEQHMPEEHRQYLEWNGDRFRRWAAQTGPCTEKAVDAILRSHTIERQAYKSCLGILKLAERYSAQRLETACSRALSYSCSPNYKSIKNILAADSCSGQQESCTGEEAERNVYGVTRGVSYYGRTRK